MPTNFQWSVFVNHWPQNRSILEFVGYRYYRICLCHYNQFWFFFTLLWNKTQFKYPVKTDITIKYNQIRRSEVFLGTTSVTISSYKNTNKVNWQQTKVSFPPLWNNCFASYNNNNKLKVAFFSCWVNPVTPLGSSSFCRG